MAETTIRLEREEGDVLEAVDMPDTREFWFMINRDVIEISAYITYEQANELAAFLLERIRSNE